MSNMILDCLKNIVFVPTCNMRGKLSITTLPGISVKALDMVAVEDQQSYYQVFEDIITRAVLRLESDIVASGGITTNRTPAYACIGKVVLPMQEKQVGSNTAAIRIGIPYSKYLVTEIFGIGFNSPRAQLIEITVRSALYNTVIYRQEVYVNEGFNWLDMTIPPFAATYSDVVEIHLSSGTYYYETIDAPCGPECDIYTEICGCCKSEDNEQYKSTLGLVLNVQESCSFQKLMCHYSDVIKTPLLYAAGIEFVYEAIGSHRANLFTTARVEDLHRLLPFFEGQYNTALKKAVKLIDFCDKCCFECNEEVKYTYVKP